MLDLPAHMTERRRAIVARLHDDFFSYFLTRMESPMHPAEHDTGCTCKECCWIRTRAYAELRDTRATPRTEDGRRIDDLRAHGPLCSCDKCIGRYAGTQERREAHERANAAYAAAHPHGALAGTRASHVIHDHVGALDAVSNATQDPNRFRALDDEAPRDVILPGIERVSPRCRTVIARALIRGPGGVSITIVDIEVPENLDVAEVVLVPRNRDVDKQSG